MEIALHLSLLFALHEQSCKHYLYLYLHLEVFTLIDCFGFSGVDVQSLLSVLISSSGSTYICSIS